MLLYVVDACLAVSCRGVLCSVPYRFVLLFVVLDLCFVVLCGFALGCTTLCVVLLCSVAFGSVVLS